MPIRSNIVSSNSVTPITNVLTGSLRTIFEHSYFNIILNNIYGARQSSHYFDVDYSTTQFRPVNIDLLLSQSAAIAPVQDSNYTSKRVVSSRYEGSKTISDDYQLAGRSSYGPQYTIDWTTPYFGVFEETSDSFPKGGGGSKLTISKLVFKDGTIIPLDNRNSHLFDIQNIFIPDKRAYIYYTEKSGGLNDAINVETKSIDESGFLYHSLAFYKPTNTPTFNVNPVTGDLDPYRSQEDNIVYYSFLNTNSTASIYNEEQLYGFNNLISQKNGINNELYFYFGLENTASAGSSPFNSTGYFIGMGLILRNFYPGTGEQYPSYRRYPWIRFQWMSTGSIPNYNLEVNTDLLPLKVGDYVRVYDATEAQINDEVYSYDKDIFFLQNASGSIYKDSVYDSLIENIEYTLPSNLTFLSANGGSSLVSETFLISNNSASIYKTTDRFGDVTQQSGPSDTQLLPIFNTNSDRIDVNGNASALGENIQFKKLYTVRDFSQNKGAGGRPINTEYPYWAIGPSGSLFRAEGPNGLDPFTFKQVNLGLNPSCSLNAIFFLPNSIAGYNPNWTFSQYPKSYKQGTFFVVGDSGSVFGSNDFGNNWTKLSFPRTDINLNDAFYSLFPNSLSYLTVIGNSGSIYITSGSNASGFADFSALNNNWASAFSYQYLVRDGISGNANDMISWPSQLPRHKFTFNRILNPVSYVDNNSGNSSAITNVLYFLADSGSIFYNLPFFTEATNDITSLPIITNPSLQLDVNDYDSKLGLLTGSFLNFYTTPSGFLFPSTSAFIDGLFSGSFYESLDNYEDFPLSYPLKALWLNKTGSVFLNTRLISSSHYYTSPIDTFTTKIFEQNSSASFNEMKQLGTIDYSQPTPISVPYVWIPSSQRTLLYQSASGIWAGGAVTFNRLNIDNVGYFYTASNSDYPTASFFSITETENTTGASNIYVKLGLRTPFPENFDNGGYAFAYGVNPTYGPTSLLNVLGDFRGFTGTRQAWRLYRKYSNEQYVLTKEYVPDGKGFIVPENYDPSLNYIEIAKKAGLIF